MAYARLRVRVRITAREAAELWRDVVHLDRWMSGLRVAEVGEDRTVWKVRLAGRTVSFEAVRLPTGDPTTLRWRSVSGPEHCGVVTFADRGSGCTVTAELAWHPRGLGERLATVFGFPGRRIRAALAEFRQQTDLLPSLPAVDRPTADRPSHEPVVSPAEAPLGTPGTAYGPMFPYTSPEERA